MISVGIDPGFSNLGFALATDDGFATEKVVPRDLGIPETVDYLLSRHEHPGGGILVLERYVAYGGVTNSDSENILMLIGAIHHGYASKGYDVRLMRAIDWKIILCKHLVKTSTFSNPSPKLDKKFSFAAAEHICGKKPKTDHEADALCLARYGQLLKDGVFK